MEELFLDCYREDGGSTLLQNDGDYLPVDTVLHPS